MTHAARRPTLYWGSGGRMVSRAQARGAMSAARVFHKCKHEGSSPKHQFFLEGQAVSGPLSFTAGRGRARRAEEPATQHRSYARSNPGTRPTRRQTRRQTSLERVKEAPRARLGGARKGSRESRPRGVEREAPTTSVSPICTPSGTKRNQAGTKQPFQRFCH